MEKVAKLIDFKSVFITGGASGLGLSLASVFARDGWRVGLADIDNSRLSDAKQLLETVGAEVCIYDVDVSNFDDLKAAVDDFAADGLGIMINNAGIAAGGNFLERPLEDWQHVLNVNLMGVVNGCRAALPHLLPHRAILHNVASAAAFMSAPMMSSYNASKAAALSLTETLVGEFSQAPGLRISASLPAFFKTNLLTSLRASDEERDVARLLMEHSGYTVEDAARDILAGIANGDTYIFAPARLKMLWRFKRFLPQKFLKVLPEKRRKRIELLRKRDGAA